MSMLLVVNFCWFVSKDGRWIFT